MSDGALLANLVVFAGVLRRCGLDVPPGRLVDAARGLEWIGVRSRSDVHATLRSLFVNRRDDMPVFDEAFELFWRSRGTSHAGPVLRSLGERPRVRASAGPRSRVGLEAQGEPSGGSGTARLAFGAWSGADVSPTKDFAEWSADELARAEALFANPRWRLATRRTRRWSRGVRGRVDLRRAMRRSMREAGEIVTLPRRQRLVRPRPVIVIADVSGSMDRYSRLLLQFTYGLSRGPHRLEAFVFATRLTRITRELAARRGRTLAAAERAAPDWGGGTRIGGALRAFNVHWARRVMRHGPVVLIVSDGWDRGDPALLAREAARLRRSCRRLMWLNPLLGSASYEPLTRGMRAALPFVDDFLPVHNLESLDALAARLQALPPWSSRGATPSMRR